MDRTFPSSKDAARAQGLVEGLQERFVAALAAVGEAAGAPSSFVPVEWLRDEGRHGGGVRFVARDEALFDRASINVSSVHYDDDPKKRLASATALSCIVHPRNPHAPSMHMHISWTEMRKKPSEDMAHAYLRVMADLNPSIPRDEDTARFDNALREVAPALYEDAAARGDRYFHIPALDRHRGVSHYYLENYNTGDLDVDLAFARKFGDTVIETYASILGDARQIPVGDEDADAQIAYHTLYLFQVLTLDRGTTSGLLVHDQNDVGILGSLPSHIDRARLVSWRDKLPAPQEKLLDALAAVLPDEPLTAITDEVKAALAAAVRGHYRAHPEAMALQASGDVVPTTVDNHR